MKVKRLSAWSIAAITAASIFAATAGQALAQEDQPVCPFVGNPPVRQCLRSDSADIGGGGATSLTILPNQMVSAASVLSVQITPASTSSNVVAIPVGNAQATLTTPFCASTASCAAGSSLPANAATASTTTATTGAAARAATTGGVSNLPSTSTDSSDPAVGLVLLVFGIGLTAAAVRRPAESM